MQTTYTLSTLDSIAEQIISLSKSKILLFYGEMGAGKTTLIKSLTKYLGVKEIASSPTFSIVNEYRGANDLIIYHFDMYRLDKPEEALDFGFDEYLEQGDWIFIEWPDKVLRLIDENYDIIDIKLIDESKRMISLR